MNNQNKYRNYIFDIEGAVSLVLGLILGIIFLAIFFAIYTFFNIENLQNVDKLEKIASSMIFNMFAYLCTVFMPILGFYFFIQKRKGKSLNFNMQSRPFHVYLLIFPMMFGMMLIAEFFTNLIPIKGKFFGGMYDSFSDALSNISMDSFGLVILTTLFAPLLEEILFRGIIQKGLINKGMKPMNAIVLSAFLFGAFHLNPWQFVGAFLLGLVLGLVYFKTKSLLMPILLHAFNNGISSYLLITGKTESFGDLFGIENWYVLLIGILIFSLFYYLFMFRNKIYYRE